MTARVCLIAALLATPLALIAEPTLPPAPFAVPAAGTEMHWHNIANGKRTKTVFNGVDGFLVRLERNGKPASRVLFCWGCHHDEVRFSEDEYAAIWPLSVGKVVEFERTRNVHTWMERVEVISTETVDLGFGPIDTYVVQHDSRGLSYDTKPWRASERIWYAPSLQWQIKNEGWWKNEDTGQEREWQFILERHREP